MGFIIRDLLLLFNIFLAVFVVILFGIFTFKPTILNCMLHIFKLVRQCRTERNRPDVIQRKYDCLAWFLG